MRAQTLSSKGLSSYIPSTTSSPFPAIIQTMPFYTQIKSITVVDTGQADVAAAIGLREPVIP